MTKEKFNRTKACAIMKHFLIIFFMSLLVQSLRAQDENVIYVDEDGRALEKWEIGMMKKKNAKDASIEIKFQEVMPKKISSHQIVVQTIGFTEISSSSDINVGSSYYLFEVMEAEDSSLIGKPVVCQVIERRKSNILGSEGRLILRPLYIEKGSLQIPISSSDIYRRGLNRTNIKFWFSPLIVPLFIPGTGAKILPNEKILLNL